MPTQRLSMRRIKQLLTMHFGAGASARSIARELGISPRTVRDYLGRASAAGIGWPLAADVTDARVLVEPPYLILYRIVPVGPQIVRVLHGARHIDAALFGEGME